MKCPVSRRGAVSLRQRFRALGERLQLLVQAPFERGILLADGHAPCCWFLQQTGAERIGRRAHNHITAFGSDPAQLVIPRDPDIGHLKRGVDIDRCGFGDINWQIVVANQQHGRRQLRQGQDAPGEGALVGRVWAAAAKGIAGEYHQIDIMLAGIIDHFVHAPQKIAHTTAQTGIGIDLAVVFHADMHIGEMQNAYGFNHGLTVARRGYSSLWR